MISLATSRLLLRPWVAADREPFVALCGDGRVMRFIGDCLPLDRERSLKRFGQIPKDWDKVGYGLLAVERRSDQRFLGFAGLSTPDVLPQLLPATEVGWRLTPECWGQGYGTEAALAVVDWAFSQLGRQSLLAIIHQDNKPSIRIAEKLNMTRAQVISDKRYRHLLEVYQLEVAAWQKSVEQESVES